MKATSLSVTLLIIMSTTRIIFVFKAIKVILDARLLYMHFFSPYSKPSTALLAFLGHDILGESVDSFNTRIQEPS